MKIIMPVCAALLLIAGCKKDTAQLPEADKTTDYFPTTAGSYWVYDNYYQLSPTATPLYEGIDSTWIVKDSTINGRSYTVFATSVKNSTSYTIKCYRDSSDYIVDAEGTIVFALDKDHVLSEGTYSDPYRYKDYLRQNDTSVTVPAGTFTSKCLIREIYATDSTWTDKDYASNFYSKDIGLIQYNYFFLSSPKEKYTRKLARYHIAQ
jgi:archaellum component FlaF (FlaF/FlaG flagellin family)